IVNIFSFYSTKAISITVTDKIAPSINLHSTCPESWPKSEQLPLQARIDIDFHGCVAAAHNYTWNFTWTQKDSSNTITDITSRNGADERGIQIVNVPKLSSVGTYQFAVQMFFYNGLTKKLEISISDQCSVAIVHSDLQIVITGGNRLIPGSYSGIKLCCFFFPNPPPLPLKINFFLIMYFHVYVQYIWTPIFLFFFLKKGTICVIFLASKLAANSTYLFTATISHSSTDRNRTDSVYITTTSLTSSSSLNISHGFSFLSFSIHAQKTILGVYIYTYTHKLFFFFLKKKEGYRTYHMYKYQ
ncbi:hypothetical protein RFI_31942, partial [Reticulomyxa filosa]